MCKDMCVRKQKKYNAVFVAPSEWAKGYQNEEDVAKRLWV